MRKAFLGALGIAFAACALMAPTASAAGQMKLMIREFYPGGADNDSYLVLQAYAPNQTQIAGHFVTWTTAPPVGAPTEGKFTFPTNVTNTASQATILIADDGYTGGPAPDFTVPDFAFYREGGSLCMDFEQEQVEPYAIAVTDCIAWGGGGGAQPPQPDPGVGYPAFQLGGVPEGKAGRRLIGLGCPTLLEQSDSTHQGNSDFRPAPPTPRNQASPIVETPCTPPSSGINSATVNEGETTTATSVRIAFSAAPLGGTTFECKLDSGAFAPCVSPVEYTGLDGDDTPSGTPHKFEVRASNASGVEQTPASLNWIVNTNPSTLSAQAPVVASTAAVASLAQPTAGAAVQSAPAQRASAKKKHKKRRAHRARRAHRN